MPSGHRLRRSALRTVSCALQQPSALEGKVEEIAHHAFLPRLTMSKSKAYVPCLLRIMMRIELVSQCGRARV